MVRNHIPNGILFFVKSFFILFLHFSTTALMVPVLTSCQSAKEVQAICQIILKHTRLLACSRICAVQINQNMVLCLCMFPAEKGWSLTRLHRRYSVKWHRKLVIKQHCHCKLLWSRVKSSSSFGAQPGPGLEQVVIVLPCC